MGTTTEAKSTALTDMSMEHYGIVVQAVAEELRGLRASLVETAGTIARTHTPHDSRGQVTDLSTAVEDHVIEQLHAADPGTPVIGTGHSATSAARRYWLVKPIDGAMHFAHGNPYYSCMFTLIVDGAPVVGAIYDFANDHLYYAIRGHGAYRNGERMYVSARSAADAVVLTDTWASSAYGTPLQKALATHYRLFNLFAPGHELAMIASGSAEARVCVDTTELDGDFAAGALLVQEAGGVARNLSGADYRTSDHDLIIASSPELYEQLCSLVVTARESAQPAVLHAAM
jgi:fructose-1,6-bisphosphatase/inositol monophosphatase family enzyme